MQKLIVLLFHFVCITHAATSQNIPLPEHPRPDFERTAWQNLNGLWQFEFDSLDQGVSKKWNEDTTAFTHKITVPFPWGSVLSGVPDKADIAWYQREINVNPEWKNKRTFLTIGASDWETTVWLDGNLLENIGVVIRHFRLISRHTSIMASLKNLLCGLMTNERVFTLYGKQGYGNARGLWQTVYLEAPGKEYIDAIHFRPDIDQSNATVIVYLAAEAASDLKGSLTIKTPGTPITSEVTIPKEKTK